MPMERIHPEARVVRVAGAVRATLAETHQPEQTQQTHSAIPVQLATLAIPVRPAILGQLALAVWAVSEAV